MPLVAYSGILLGIQALTNLNIPKKTMGTFLLLLASALLCFAVFYKLIEWFEQV